MVLVLYPDFDVVSDAVDVTEDDNDSVEEGDGLEVED